MTRFAGVIRIEPARSGALSAWGAALALAVACPIPLLAVPWWASVLAAAAWLTVCWRGYRDLIARAYPSSVTCLALDRDGVCFLDFADGPRQQRAALTGRLTTASWVLLRLHAPQRKVTVLVTRSCVSYDTWCSLQIRLRWRRKDV